jgi:hypothetical protein
MTDKQIEKTIMEINANMAIEDMPLTEKDKENIRLVLNGTISFEEMTNSIVNKWRMRR